MNRRGFTLVEIALVLAVAGFVAYGSLALLDKIWREKQRVEAGRELMSAKAALQDYIDRFGEMPVPESGRYLPTTELNLKKTDVFGERVRYCVQPGLTDKNLACSRLKNLLDNEPAVVDSWYPLVWTEGLPESPGVRGIPVAAVFFSAAADSVPNKLIKDTDNDGTPDLEVGDNANSCSASTESFVQSSLVNETFDDLLVFVAIPELYDLLECEN